MAGNDYSHAAHLTDGSTKANTIHDLQHEFYEAVHILQKQYTGADCSEWKCPRGMVRALDGPLPRVCGAARATNAQHTPDTLAATDSFPRPFLDSLPSPNTAVVEQD